MGAGVRKDSRRDGLSEGVGEEGFDGNCCFSFC